MKYLALLLFPLMLLANEEVIIEVPGMHCPLCTTAVKKGLSQIKGVEKVKVLLETKKATVLAKEGIEDNIYLDAIQSTGFTGVIVSRQLVKN